MTGNELLEKLLQSYRSSYDIERPYVINGDNYDAHASFTVTSAKYVLIKKAELWRANCFEHVFFCVKKELKTENLEQFNEHIVSYIEPVLVRHDQKWPEKNHMYTYMTAVYICEDGVEKETIKAIKKFSYMKNYLLSIRGYSQARILVFDLKNKKIYGNNAAKEMVKGYKKSRILETL